MKKLFYNLGIVLLSTFLSTSTACAAKGKESSVIETRTINVSRVSGLEASGIEVIITPGRSTGTANISGPKSILDEVQIENRDGNLKVILPEAAPEKAKVRLVITADIKALHAFGGSRVSFSGAVETSGSFLIDCASKSSVNLSMLRAGSAEIKSSSGAKVRIVGIEVDGELTLDAESKGDIRIDKLNAATTNGHCFSKGCIRLLEGNAGACDLKASSGGNIIIKADMASIHWHTDSGGRVRVL